MTVNWIAGVVLWRDAWWAPFATVGALHGLQALILVGRISPRPPHTAILRYGVYLPALVYFWIDLLLNPRYTFGSKLRDVMHGCLLWYFLYTSLVILWTYDDRSDEERKRESIPRWCVPDWEREEQERGMPPTSEKNDKMQGKPAKQSWWCRAPMAKRPKWAREQRVLPRYWRILPLPSTLPDTMIWLLDVLSMRRHSTATLFAEEMRGLEWMKTKFELAGEAQFKARQAGWSRPQHAPHILPFGYADSDLKHSLLEGALFCSAWQYMRYVDIDGSEPADFYRLPWTQQLAITLCLGIIMTMMWSLTDIVMLPLLQRWPLYVPATALYPAFRSTVESKSVTELWQWRWHTAIKRDLIRLARMTPPYGERWQRDPAVNIMKAFFWSGLMHSLILVRVRPPPTWSDPTSIIHIFCRPHAMLFFLAQGFIIIIEQTWPRVFLLQPDSDSRAAKWVPYARNAWVWGVVIATGHLLAVETLAGGLLTYEEMSLSYPVTEAIEVYGYFRKHLFGGQ